ncbi:MAG: DNA-directed RNA polymerase [Candidatus Thermoplasmatota archaeon]|nr:DNA-directed RNA polymerase [Candidatus Thermoplasmatota archaeon]
MPEEFSRELELDTHSHGKKDGLQRLAAIIEYDRLLTRYESEEVNGDWNEVYSGLPVHLDASCNGYQHISTLFRNVELAKTVNVITSDGGSRDVYELVAEAAKQRYSTEVRKFLNDNLEGSLANIAFERIFDRRLAKKPTMTRAYGSTRFTKAMSGRSGQGASIRSKPQLREWTKVQRKRIEWLEEKHPKFIKAREEYLENTKLGKRHYEKHAVKYKSKAELLEILRNNGYKGKREGAEPGKILKSNATRYELIEVVEGDSSISEEAVAFKWNKDSSEAESVAKSWMNLLKEEEEYQLWADGSGLHWAILEHPELRKEFCYDRDDAEGCGHLWKKQPELTKKTVKSFKGAIEEVCGVVYGDFEESFSRAVERSMGRYPGVRWETSETVDDTDSGFVVSNYYMKTQEGGSKAKWPTKRDSCYSGMTSLPHWYSESKDRGGWESEVKTTDRIKEKLRRFLDGLDRQVPRKMRNWEKRGKSGIEDVLGWVSSGKDDLSYLVDAIRPLLGHVSISVPFFSDNEDSRIDLDSMSSSICPNFIHSLDACHMRTAINRLGREFGDLGFWAVHDSFGTHPSRVGKLRDVVIASFWDIHRGRDIDWWLGKLKGPDGKLGMDEDGKLVSKESSKVFNIAEETSRSKYLIS